MLLRLHLATQISGKSLGDVIIGSLIQSDQPLSLEAKAFRCELVEKLRKASIENNYIDLSIYNLCILLNCLSASIPVIGIVDVFEASITEVPEVVPIGTPAEEPAVQPT